MGRRYTIAARRPPPAARRPPPAARRPLPTAHCGFVACPTMRARGAGATAPDARWSRFARRLAVWLRPAHNAAAMSLLARLLFLSAAVGAVSAPALADVSRCTDARGRVVYTDQPCPSGTLQTGAVPVPETAPPGYQGDDGPRQAQVDSAERAARLQRETVEAARRQAQPELPADRGLSVIGTPPRPSPDEQRWSDRPEDRAWVDPWGGYPGGYYPGAGYHPQRPRPPIDQRPVIRNCDAGGCTDTLGNHYNRKGQLDRYEGPGGKTCRPVGSTSICR